MPPTLAQDVFIPEIATEVATATFPERLALGFGGSPFVRGFPGTDSLGQAGDAVKFPRWEPIGVFADMVEDTPLVPEKLTHAMDTAPVVVGGKAGEITDWADLVHGPTRDWGQLNCGCHPNCGIGMAIMVDKDTKESVPVTAFLKAGRLSKDLARVNDAARGRFLSVVGMALALMRNYDPFAAPKHFKLVDLMRKFDKTFGATGHDYGKVTGDRTKADIDKRRTDRWKRSISTD